MSAGHQPACAVCVCSVVLFFGATRPLQPVSQAPAVTWLISPAMLLYTTVPTPRASALLSLLHSTHPCVRRRFCIHTGWRSLPTLPCCRE